MLGSQGIVVKCMNVLGSQGIVVKGMDVLGSQGIVVKCMDVLGLQGIVVKCTVAIFLVRSNCRVERFWFEWICPIMTISSTMAASKRKLAGMHIFILPPHSLVSQQGPVVQKWVKFHHWFGETFK